MSNRRWAVRASIASSSGVSRSTSSVASVASLRTRATWRLRGLSRLLPLPCANSTTPRASSGRARLPSSVTPAAGTRTMLSTSHREGVRLRQLAGVPLGRALERLHRARLVEVQHRVELLRQARAEVVALALGVGTVDHADRPLEAGVVQARRHEVALAPGEQETRPLRRVEHHLVAARHRGADVLAL